MKVVALVSGGKDSCYAMMKCINTATRLLLWRICCRLMIRWMNWIATCIKL
ncbi:hypothetical protein Patl1_23156 [Pistacia atlantica]|uniref:Uncharacterized protein n=1 Tax=Pistacia atlantica TaxID=434234 RepID=A0ACC0ZVJ9_9ROSI|nr:hypothetical protein Patl1_23156 [Pistacia atlantica]